MRQARGKKRLRGDSWQLRAYAGIHEGREVWLAVTLPPRLVNGTYVPATATEADEALRRLVTRAGEQREARRVARQPEWMTEVLGQ